MKYKNPQIQILINDCEKILEILRLPWPVEQDAMDAREQLAGEFFDLQKEIVRLMKIERLNNSNND